MNYRVATLIAGCVVGLAAAQSLGLFGGGSPSVISPCPIWLVVPIFLGVPAIVAVAVLTAIFLVWRPSLFQGATAVPIRTYVLWGVITILSGIWIVAGWRYGLKYEGSGYTTVCALVSLAFFCLSAFALWQARKTPSFTNALLAQTLLFVWLASYALPYLGETP